MMPDCRVKEMTASEGGTVVVAFTDGAFVIVKDGKVGVACPPALRQFPSVEAYAEEAKKHLERESFPWKEEVLWNGTRL